MNQVSGTDRLGTKAEMRDGHRTRLLGIINKVALNIVGSFFSNNLDGVLIGAYRSVGPQPIEHCAEDLLRLGGEAGIVLEVSLGDIIDDPHRKMVLGLLLLQFSARIRSARASRSTG